MSVIFEKLKINYGVLVQNLEKQNQLICIYKQFIKCFQNKHLFKKNYERVFNVHLILHKLNWNWKIRLALFLII